MTTANDLALIVLSVGLFLLDACHGPHKEGSMESSPQREEIARLRAAYEAFNRGDIEAAVEPLDLEIEWRKPAEFPGGGTYRPSGSLSAVFRF